MYILGNKRSVKTACECDKAVKSTYDWEVQDNTDQRLFSPNGLNSLFTEREDARLDSLV